MEAINETDNCVKPCQRNWLSRVIRIVGLLALLEGAPRLTEMLTAQLCGWNIFELRDGIEMVIAGTLLVSGYGTVLFKNWARFVLIACQLVKLVGMSGAFYFVASSASKAIDIAGWMLVALTFGFAFCPIAVLLMGWRRAVVAALPQSKIWRNMAALSVLLGVTASLLTKFDFGENVIERADLDASFLHRSNSRVFFPAHSALARRRQHGWRISIKEKEGKTELYPLPPSGSCLAEFDPKTGVLKLHGYAFSGQPYAAEPVLIGGKPLRGLTFKRENGPISGTITFGEDATGSLYLFLESLNVCGKKYEGIWNSPTRW